MTERKSTMPNWKEKAAYMLAGISSVDEARSNHLKLQGNPDNIRVGEIETVVASTEVFNPEALDSRLPEFLMYHVFNPYPIGGYYVKDSAWRKLNL